MRHDYARANTSVVDDILPGAPSKLDPRAALRRLAKTMNSNSRLLIDRASAAVGVSRALFGSVHERCRRWFEVFIRLVRRNPKLARFVP